MSKFRHIEVSKEEFPPKKSYKKIKDEHPSNYSQTMNLMEKLGIKVINSEKLQEKGNLKKSINLNVKNNISNLKEEEKLTKSIKSLSLEKRKKKMNNRDYISSSNEKRIIKKGIIKKFEIKYNNKENIKKLEEENYFNIDKDNNISNNKRKSESIEARYPVRSDKKHSTEITKKINFNKIINRNISNKINNNKGKRKSKDNAIKKEKLENLINSMTLRHNGGNTLYLTNYEKGDVYSKKIELKIKNKNFIKNIKICSCTKAGCSSPGIVKVNQDSFFIKEKFLGNENYFFLGVCDGHGEQGELISQYVADKLPEYIKNINHGSIINEFKKINNEIYLNKNIESNTSGTTVSSLIITSEKIISINLGDSRSCLFFSENGIYSFKNLTRDHKPTEKDESLRVIKNSGRIKRCYDKKNNRYIGPERVWLKNKEEPGLAMTRSLGDKIAHNIGVIEEPEFKIHEYDGNEKFIIIASDGLWEYLKGDDCIRIVKNYYEENKDIEKASFALVKEAFDKWKRKEVIIDDITAIVIFFYD